MARRGLLAFAFTIHAASAGDCRVLSTLSFKQHEAPSDMSSMLSTVTELINDELEGVEDVRVRWEGDFLHHRIGRHTVTADVVSRTGAACYEIDVDVGDTDECSVRVAGWAHTCDSSAACVNTEGGYECACAADVFAPLGAPHDCGGRGSTADCCLGKNSADRAACASAFACEKDRCGEACARNAVGCARTLVDRGGGRMEAAYACECPPGTVGDGTACPFGQAEPAYVDAAGNVAGKIPCGCAVASVDRCAGVACGERSTCADDGREAACVCDGVGINHWSTAGLGYLQTPLPRSNRTRFP